MVVEENSTILLDTNSFIYYFEDNENFADKLEEIFSSIQEGKCKAFMSVLSVLEILVKPKKQNNLFLENKYKLMLMNYPNLSLVDVTFEISDIAARLRAEHNIKTPDAIVLATALHANVDYIVTYDNRFRNICERENIKGYNFA